MGDNKPAYEILFLFSAAEGWLVEIKRLGLPADAPKQSVYHWLWWNGGTVAQLDFRSMATSPLQRREFDQATLCFDAGAGELQWRGGDRVALTVQAHHALPDAVHLSIRQHLGL